MIAQRRKEFEFIRGEYGEIEVDAKGQWFIVRRWQLPPGWNKSETALLVLVPPGYPVTPPDNFYTEPDLRLADGRRAGNTSLCTQVGKQWQQFSYHVRGNWQPHADILSGHNLLTFLNGVEQRLMAAS